MCDTWVYQSWVGIDWTVGDLGGPVFNGEEVDIAKAGGGGAAGEEDCWLMNERMDQLEVLFNRSIFGSCMFIEKTGGFLHNNMIAVAQKIICIWWNPMNGMNSAPRSVCIRSVDGSVVFSCCGSCSEVPY